MKQTQVLNRNPQVKRFTLLDISQDRFTADHCVLISRTR